MCCASHGAGGAACPGSRGLHDPGMKRCLCWGSSIWAEMSISDDRRGCQSVEQPRGLWPHCRAFRGLAGAGNRRCWCCRRRPITCGSQRTLHVVSAPRERASGCGWSRILVGLKRGHSMNTGWGVRQLGSSLVPAAGQAGEDWVQVASAEPRGEALQGALSGLSSWVCSGSVFWSFAAAKMQGLLMC